MKLAGQVAGEVLVGGFGFERANLLVRGETDGAAGLGGDRVIARIEPDAFRAAAGRRARRPARYR